MRVLRKALSAFLLGILFLSIALFPGSAQEAPSSVALVYSVALPDGLTVLPDKSGGFYLVSSDTEKTLLSYLDGKTGAVSRLQELNAPYTAAALCGGSIALAYPVWKNEGGSVIFQSEILLFSPEDGEKREIRIGDTYIQSPLDFALLPDGFAVVDSRDRSHIRRFDLTGKQISTLAAESPVFQIAAGEDGSLCAGGSQGEFYMESGNSLLSAPGEVPTQPFSLLGDSCLLSGEGGLWSFSSGSLFPSYCYQTLAQDGRAGLSGNRIALLYADRILLLDRQSGAPSGQLPAAAEENDRFYVSGDAALQIREKEGERTGILTSLSSPEEVASITLSPIGGLFPEEDLHRLWEESLPVCNDPALLFEQLPDLTNFSTPGRLSVESLSDGLRAVNFYRSLYGLAPLGLWEDAGNPLQYGAVLSLYRQEDGSFFRPDAMNDTFYKLGQTGLSQPCLFTWESSAAAPLADAVHLLFRESQAFREAVLNSNGQSLALAATRSEDGRAQVFAAFAGGQDSSAPVAYPPPGCFPAQLLGDGEWSAALPESVCVGEREAPSALVTDLTDGSRHLLSPENGLRTEGRTLYLSPLGAVPGHRYRIRVEGLAVGGIPAVLEWETALSTQTLAPSGLPGDVTLDGSLTAADQSLLLDYLLGLATLSDEALAAADFNQDGVADTVDLLALHKLLTGRE